MIHFQSLTCVFWNETRLFRNETGENWNETDEISDRLGGFTSPFFPQAENAVKMIAQAKNLLPNFITGPLISIFARHQFAA